MTPRRLIRSGLWLVVAGILVWLGATAAPYEAPGFFGDTTPICLNNGSCTQAQYDAAMRLRWAAVAVGVLALVVDQVLAARTLRRRPAPAPPVWRLLAVAGLVVVHAAATTVLFILVGLLFGVHATFLAQAALAALFIAAYGSHPFAAHHRGRQRLLLVGVLPVGVLVAVTVGAVLNRARPATVNTWTFGGGLLVGMAAWVLVSFLAAGGRTSRPGPRA